MSRGETGDDRRTAGASAPEADPKNPGSAWGERLQSSFFGDAVRPWWHGPQMWMYLAIGVGVLLAVNVVLLVVLTIATRNAEFHDDRGE